VVVVTALPPSASSVAGSTSAAFAVSASMAPPSLPTPILRRHTPRRVRTHSSSHPLAENATNRAVYPADAMKLFLVRHADATPGNPDELRPLSEEGREQARELGEQLRRDGIAPEILLTSPLLRARQTGEALARATGST